MNAPGHRSLRLGWARWLLASAIFGVTMAIGGVHVVVLVAATCLLLGSTVLAWAGADPLRARRSASILVATAVLLTLYTAVTVVPLPAAWLAWLSPHTADVWARCLAPLGRPGPAWATLSLDPQATRQEVLRGVAYALAFVAASRIAARREGVVFLERALVVTGLALAAFALIHPALGVDKVFGLYTPRHDPGIRHVAPILNSNVLSGYLNITLCLLLGQVWSPRSVWPRTILAALTVALVGVLVWIASRGGLLGTVLGVVVVTWMSRSREPERAGVLKPLLIPVVLALVGAGMAVVASSEDAMGELAITDVSKLDLAREALRIVPSFPVFGIGRGAFETVFPAFRSDPMHMVYTHPENVVAQWATEWGVIPALVGFLAIGYALRPSSAQARSPRAAGAWGALASVALQNLVDFGSEYPAVVIALATCAAIVTGGTSGLDRSHALDAWARRPGLLVGIAVAASVLGIALVVPGFGHDVFDDRVALHAAALDAAVSRPEFERRAEAAMLRHPAEPYLPFTGALRAARLGDNTLLPWIERTLDRAIVYGPAHLLLARWLASRSPGQARLEYRLTIEQAPEFGPLIQPAVSALIGRYDDATELLPTNRERAYWANLLATALAPRLPATARRLDDVIAALKADEKDFAERRAAEGLVDVLSGPEAPWCNGPRRAGCIEDALARADRVTRLLPLSCSGYATRARLVYESGDAARALKELQTAAPTVLDRTACFEALADLATIARSDAVVTQALDRVAHAGCATDQECIANLRYVAATESARGNDRSAYAALKKATAKAPSDDVLLADTAALAAKIELHAEALHAYQTLAQRHPDEAKWGDAVLAEKNALVTGAIPY